MKFGAHLSIAKGLPALLAETERIGGSAAQAFARNPRGRGETIVPPEAAAEFRAELKKRDWPFIIHAPYYVNLGSGTPNNQRIARDVVKLDLEKGDLLGASGVVVHFGSAGEGFEVETATEHTIRTIKEVLGTTDAKTKLLLETSAGSRRVASRFEQLAEILEGVGEPDRVGVCFDTCHVFVSGYDIRGEGMGDVLDDFDNTVGWNRVEVIHCNDTQSSFDGGRDAHYHIGLGEIGQEAFEIMLTDSRLQEKVMILETPKEPKGAAIDKDTDSVNLAKLKSLANV